MKSSWNKVVRSVSTGPTNSTQSEKVWEPLLEGNALCCVRALIGFLTQCPLIFIHMLILAPHRYILIALYQQQEIS